MLGSIGEYKHEEKRIIMFSITKELIVAEDRMHTSLYLIRKWKENTVSGHKSGLRKYLFCSNKDFFLYAT